MLDTSINHVLGRWCFNAHRVSDNLKEVYNWCEWPRINNISPSKNSHIPLLNLLHLLSIFSVFKLESVPSNEQGYTLFTCGHHHTLNSAILTHQFFESSNSKTNNASYNQNFLEVFTASKHVQHQRIGNNIFNSDQIGDWNVKQHCVKTVPNLTSSWANNNLL